jgi:hypothetical protein
MKRLFLIFLLLSVEVVSQHTLSGVLPLSSGKVSYKEVHEIVGQQKEILIENAKAWFIVKKASHVNEEEIDKKHQNIKGKISFKTLWGPNDFPELYKEVQYNVEIIAKNNRYQYEFTNFIVKDPGKTSQLEIYKSEQKKYDAYNHDFYVRIDKEVKKMIASLVQKMNTPIETEP